MNKNVITMSVMMAMQATKREQQDRCFNIKKTKQINWRWRKKPKAYEDDLQPQNMNLVNFLLNPQPKLAKIDIQPRLIWLCPISFLPLNGWFGPKLILS
jgi:hypothetical protein